MNCRPNILARIVRSYVGNVGRIVAVLRAPNAGDGFMDMAGPSAPPYWVVKPLQPLRRMSPISGAVTLCMEDIVFPDAWLMPIGDQRDGLAQREADPVDVTAVAWG